MPGSGGVTMKFLEMVGENKIPLFVRYVSHFEKQMSDDFFTTANS